MSTVPVLIQDDTQYFAGTQSFSRLWNQNNGPFIKSGSSYVLLTRWLKHSQAGVWQSLQMYKIGTGALDDGNAIAVASPTASPVYPNPSSYVAARYPGADRVWSCFLFSQGPFGGGSAGNNSFVCVKAFNLSTGLWEATSSVGPNVTNNGGIGGFMGIAVLSTGTLVLFYRFGANGGTGLDTITLNAITYTPGTDTWGSPVTIDTGTAASTNSTFAVFGVQTDKLDKVHLLYAFMDGPHTTTVLKHVRWDAGSLSSITTLASVASNIGGLTTITLNDWGHYDSSTDTVLFSVSYVNSQNSVPTWFPKNLSAVVVTSASGGFAAAIEGVEDVTRTGPFGFNLENWFSPSGYIASGNLNVAVAENDTSFITAPRYNRIRIFRRPISGGSWVEETAYFTAQYTNPGAEYAVNLTDPPMYLVCGTTGLSTLFEFTEGTVDTTLGTTTKPRTYYLTAPYDTCAMTVACPVATPQQNVPYNSPLVVSGGTPPYTFSITAGALPNGLTLNTSTGYISGVPTGGPYSYTAQVTDSLGATATTTCSGSQRLPDGGGPGGQTGSCRTIIHLWQLSRVAKPEVIQLRYGDWYDFKQAAYIRGVIIRADTFGFNKQLSIRNSDNNALIQFSGGPSPGIIQHSGEQEIAYYFTPFVSHMVREEPQDQVQWRKFQIEWIYDPWPELTDLDSAWLDLGAQGAKYLRGAVIPMDTNGQPVSLTFLSSDGGTRTVGPFTTTAAEKTAVGWAFDIPLIGHDFQLIPTGPIRVWYEEIRWDFDPWPELIREATGWMPVRPGGGASFLQGLVLPIETDGNLPALSLLTDTGAVIPLTPIVTPPANIKTGVPYSLATPTVCHQVQLLPTSPCRIWLNEIQWVAEATPELAANWITQWTAHGLKGYQHIAWIEVAYAATAAATLAIAVQDGTAPTTVTLPSTGGVYQKTLVSLTFNKFMQAQYSLTSTQPLQVFLEDWTVYLGPWGRPNEYIAYKNLGGSFGDKARI